MTRKPGRPRQITLLRGPERAAKVVELHRKGLSYARIAKTLGISVARANQIGLRARLLWGKEPLYDTHSACALPPSRDSQGQGGTNHGENGEKAENG